jgi:glycerol-3-phosphate O-acyltransferase / dihydroxyacetone phosphate acyltransferase
VARRLLRRLGDALAARWARLVMGVFFRDVEVVGAQRLPRPAPLLVIANHVNNLIDPMLILGYLDVRPRFLAKSTLWRHPVVAPLVVLMGALPVYRRRDNAPVARNIETFARCRVALAGGDTIALFPEGHSHNEPGAVPLKTGAARIALEAGAEGAPGLRIVPVGIVYEDKQRFRSRVLLQVGEPIDPAAELASYAEAPRAAVQALTARIAAGLESVTAPFASWEEARLIDHAVDLALEGDPAALPLSDRWSLWREFTARYATLEKADPEHAQRLVGALREYDEQRRRLGLGEHDLAAGPDGGGRARVRDVLERLAMAPGALLNWVPYTFSGRISDRFTRTPDQPASYKVVGAILFFPLWWALEIGLAWALAGPLAALVVAVASPLSGLLALRLHDRRRLRPRTRGGDSAEHAALRDRRADLRRRIRDVVGARA